MQLLPAQPSRVQSGVGLPLAQQLEELCPTPAPTHRQLLLCTCLWLCGGVSTSLTSILETISFLSSPPLWPLGKAFPVQALGSSLLACG